MNTLNRKLLLLFSVIFLCVFACAPQPQKFDSKQWKDGGKSVRGGMVKDLRERNLLVGKTKEEIKNLLGEPDAKYTNTWDYNVITISRCYFWNCRMEIYFDRETNKVRENPAVSD